MDENWSGSVGTSIPRGRSLSRASHRVWFVMKRHSARIVLGLLATVVLVTFVALSASKPYSSLDASSSASLYKDFAGAAAGDLAARRAARASGGGSLTTINEFLTEYPAGPNAILHTDTIDPRHLHGRFGEDPQTHQPLWKPEPLTFRMTPEQKTEAHRGYCFNTRVSKSIELDREVPDFNDQKCRDFDYSKYSLPAADVVIVFHNEDLSALLRSIASILNRTPPALLHQLILLNDASNKTSHPWLFEELPRFVRSAPKTRLIYSSKRLGLMMARVHASNVSTGIGAPVIVYLDSHIECANGWLEPLLLEIGQNYRTIVTPLIHTIGADSLEFVKGALTTLSFSWSLGQTHPRETIADPDSISPVPSLISPVMAGGLFAASRRWFIDELEGYDDEMKLYGGEEMEIGFKTWMCGGKLVNVQCSRVGHIFRTDKHWKGQVYKVPFEEILRNKRRVAEVWMDDYLKIYNEVTGELEIPLGDLTKPKSVRTKLNCKSFKWYLDNIATDVWVPDMENTRRGAVFNPASQVCLDSMQNTAGGLAGAYHCHGRRGSQTFLMDKGTVRFGALGFKDCLEPTSDHKRVQIVHCDNMEPTNQWEYTPLTDEPLARMLPSRDPVPVGLLKHVDGKCLRFEPDSENVLADCDANDKFQHLGWSD